MVNSLLGQKIKVLRKERDWTQDDLAKRSGVDRGTLASIETGKAKNPTTANLLKLARAFNIRPEELYQAAGYITEAKVAYPYRHTETSGEILERLRLAHPIGIPVYTEFPFHAGEGVEPVEYVYRARTKPSPRNIEGYLVNGDSLAPDVLRKDIVIVDRDGEIDSGNIVAALVGSHLYISRFRKIGDELWLENNYGRVKFEECQVAAPVIEVIRRLK